MAFVNCEKYKREQAAQDERLESLEECCKQNTAKNTAQDAEIEALKESIEDNATNQSIKDGEQDEAIEELRQAIANNAERDLTKNEEQDEKIAQLEECCENSASKNSELEGKLANADNSMQVDQDGLKVRISNLENNILQLREDGLFISNNPNDYYQSFHVHAAQGSDESGDGSKENPYRTIGKALSEMKNIPSNVDLFLYKGLTYEANWGYYDRFKEFCNISIHAYDNETQSGKGVVGYPYGTSNNAYYRGHIAKSYPRPTLRFKTALEHDLRFALRPCIIASKVAVYGIQLVADDRVDNDNPEYSGNFDGCLTASSHIELYGCTVEWIAPTSIGSGAGAYRTDVLLRGGIRWVNSQLKTDLSAGQYKTGLVSSNYTSEFRAIDWHGSHLEGYGESPNYETLTGNFEGVVQNIKPDVISSTGGSFVNGVAFNWNLNG